MDLQPLIANAKIASAGKTGTWRNYRPVVDEELCTECGVCTDYCPEGVMFNGKIDYEFCKGCGICRELCKQGAIKMLPE